MTNANLRVGPVAIRLMHHFESCSLTAYRDAVGIPTIGWGMTYYPDGKRVQMGDRITQAQADDMFAEIMERDFASVVREALGTAPTTPAQFGAMVALSYNIGIGPKLWVPGRKQGFRQSQVLKQHRAGNYAAAADAFLSWTKAGGKVLSGLVRRRKAEAALYRSDFAALAAQTHNEVKP